MNLEKSYKTNIEHIWDLIKKRDGLTAKEIASELGNYNIERIYFFLSRLSKNPVEKKKRLIKIEIESNPNNKHSKKSVNQYRIIKE